MDWIVGICEVFRLDGHMEGTRMSAHFQGPSPDKPYGTWVLFGPQIRLTDPQTKAQRTMSAKPYLRAFVY